MAPPRRRRWPRRLGVGLVVLLALLTGVDFGARLLAEEWLSGQIRTATGAERVSATIGAFPFLPPLLISGSVAHVDVVADGVPAGQFSFDRVSVRASEVRLDRKLLFASHVAEPVSIASAVVRADLTSAELSKALGHRITFGSGGRITVVVGQRQLPAQARVVGGHLLVVTVGGLTVATVELSRSGLLPACDLALTVSHGMMTFTCRLAPVPASLLQALAGYRADGPGPVQPP